MRRFYLKCRIALITFTLGVASVFMLNGSLYFSDEVPVNLPQVKSSSVFEIITKENWKGFNFVGHACGGRNKHDGESWVSGYRTNDWKKISISGSSHEKANGAKKEFSLRIANAFKVLESGKSRIIVENQEDENKWIDLIKYENKKSLVIINSPTLELALEFEKWRESQK